MRFGCHGSIKQAPALARAGFEFTAVTLPALRAWCEEKPSRDAAELSRGDLFPEVVCSFPPDGLCLIGPEARLAEAVAAVRDAAEMARAAGAAVVVFDSPCGRTIPERFSPAQAWDQLTRFLAAASEATRGLGLRLVVEPLPRDRADLVNTVEEAWLLCHEVGDTAVGVSASLSHLWREHEPADALIVADEALACVGLEPDDLAADAAARPHVEQAFAALRIAGFGGRVCLRSELPDPAANGARTLTALRQAAGVWP